MSIMYNQMVKSEAVEKHLNDFPKDIVCLRTQQFGSAKLVIVDTTMLDSSFRIIPIIKNTGQMAVPISGYAITNARFAEIGGYGKISTSLTQAVYLGAKNWSLGGRCVCISSLPQSSPLLAIKTKENRSMLYNKMVMAMELLPMDICSAIFQTMPQTEDTKAAWRMVERDLEEVNRARVRLEEKRSKNWLDNELFVIKIRTHDSKNTTNRT